MTTLVCLVSLLSLLLLSARAVDPLNWKVLESDNGDSCFPLSPHDVPSWSLASVRDPACAQYAGSGRCRSGLPFFRYPRGVQSACDGCLDASTCQLRCLSKGLDVAGLVSDASGEVVECRCGATAGNRAVWADLRLGTAEANLGPVSYLLPPAPASALAAEDPKCRVRIFVYQDALEVDGSPARSLLALSPADAQYLRQVTTGEADAVRRPAAVATRLALWEKAPKEEAAAEAAQKPLTFVAQSPPGCKGVDEDANCWSTAVIAMGGTCEGCTYTDWQKAFMTPFCTVGSNAQLCPITCGLLTGCHLYDRPPTSAAAVELWTSNAAFAKNPVSGLVRIPYFFNPNMQVTPTIANLLQLASQTWRNATCIDFYPVSAPPPTQAVMVTVLTDANGNPSGCSASPIGLPAAGEVASLNIGSCQDSTRLGSMIHELGHVLGMLHTQMRPDRDDYLQLVPANILPQYSADFALNPYDFEGAAGTFSPYDLGSIMHYTRTQAMNPALYNPNVATQSGTFMLRQGLPAGVVLGQRTRLSALDAAEINTLYGCVRPGAVDVWAQRWRLHLSLLIQAVVSILTEQNAVKGAATGVLSAGARANLLDIIAKARAVFTDLAAKEASIRAAA